MTRYKVSTGRAWRYFDCLYAAIDHANLIYARKGVIAAIEECQARPARVKN